MLLQEDCERLGVAAYFSGHGIDSCPFCGQEGLWWRSAWELAKGFHVAYIMRALDQGGHTVH